jgi:transcription initiation factor TFIIB
MMDDKAEWRYYGADDNKSCDPTRCGMPIDPLLKQSSYGCRVLCGYRSTYEMRKIRRYTEWQSMPYEEKSKYDEFQKIRSLAGTHGISKCIIDAALVQYQKVSTLKTFRGCNRNGIIAASIYLACRINDFPRTAKEIATIFNLDNTSSTKGCKIATHLLNGLETNVTSNNKTIFDETKPIAFIDRFCSKLSMNKELTKVCQFVAFRIDANGIIPENTPHSVAAGIVYFVAQSCKLNVSKYSVHIVSEISEVTINKCFKKLNLIKFDLIPATILDKYK